jgi:rare lipoprotein A
MPPSRRTFLIYQIFIFLSSAFQAYLQHFQTQAAYLSAIYLNSISQNADIYNMKRISAILLILAAAFCAPPVTEAQMPEIFRQEGIASWYGPEFDGRPTASGEIFNSSLLTAAHPALPFGTLLTVTNKHNNKQVTVRVNDRGPFVSARIIDISKAAAEQLDMIVTGTAPVVVESVERIVTPASGRAAPAASVAPGASDSYWTLPPAGSAPVTPVTPAYTPPPAAPAQTYAPAPAYAPAPQVTPPPVTYPQPAASELAAPITPAPAAAPIAPAAPAQVYIQPPAQTAAPVAPVAAPVPASQATVKQATAQKPDKTYRIQVGAYKIPKNAVEAYEKLKNAGLNPAYERNGEFFRVVLAGVRGIEVQSVTEKLGAAGFREVLVREEH